MTSDILNRPIIYYVHRKYVLVDEETPAVDAIKAMYLKTSDAIIVTSGHTLRGIVTNSDILQRLVVPANEKRISSIPIKSIMSSPIIWLRSNDNVNSALRLMKSNNIKHILVLDDDTEKKVSNYRITDNSTIDQNRSTESVDSTNRHKHPETLRGIVTLRSLSDDLRSSLITMRKPSVRSPLSSYYKNSIKLHYRPIIGNLGFIMQFAGILFVVPAVVGTLLQDDIKGTVGIYLTSLLLLATGFVLNAYGIKGTVGLKQGANLVLSSFMLLGLFCSIPYMYGDEFASSIFGNDPSRGHLDLLFLNSYFESISGLTTTGLTTITDTSDLSATFSFYRSYTQLVGGLSFVYLIMLIFYPEQKLASMSSIAGWGSILRPKALTLTIVVIFFLYIVILSSITYLLGGIDGINAVSITFTTITGSGFENIPSYISTDYPLRLVILMTGMIISALPFVFHYSIFSRRYRSRSISELILIYSLVLLGSTLVFHQLESPRWTSDSFFASAFTVISASTTTGLTIEDSDGSLTPYSFPAKLVLMTLMMVGGLAFSTAGGIKIDRMVLIFRRLFRLRINFNHLITGISPIRYRSLYGYRHLFEDIEENKTTGPKVTSLPTTSSGKGVKDAVYIIILFVFVSLIGGLILSHNTGYDLQDSVFESISALTTTGLSSGISSAQLDPGSKVLLIFNMIAGRFEIITIFYVFIRMLKITK